jgi:putative ABC transport system permease protein
MAKPSLHDRLFHALLALFPGEFRGDFGEQMADDFRDQRTDAVTSGSRKPLLRLWARTAADIVRRAPREHLEVLSRDAGYALRLFRRRPGMTITAVLTLAIGLGLNAAAFSVMQGVLWRSLPLEESDRLVRLFETAPPPRGQMTFVAPATALHWAQQSQELDALATLAIRSARATLDDGPEEILGAAVTPGFFKMFSSRPVLGRLLNDDDYARLIRDDASGRDESRSTMPPPTRMVISHDLWVRQFSGRTDVVGRIVDLGRGRSAEVVGVAPVGFGVPLVLNAKYWVPDVLDADDRRTGQLLAIGRLAPGMTVAEAQTELDVIATQFSAAYPDTHRERGVRIVSLLDSLTDRVRTQLWFLFGAALCVLLIACANVSNLLLTLTVGRQRELATRVALGATRGHLIRQALTEGLILALIGGAAGVGLALWAVPLLADMAPRNIPRIREVSVDGHVLAFTAIAASIVGLVSALAAAVCASRPAFTSQLRAGGVVGPQRLLIRQLLIVGEVALALVLAVAASLLVQTIRTLTALPLGFDPANVVAISVSPDRSRVDTTAARAAYEAELLARVRAIPGVVAAGTGLRPLGGGGLGAGIHLPEDPETQISIDVDPVSPGYLEALGVRLLAGRFFAESDHLKSPHVALVNQAAARRYWPDGPIGRIVLFSKQRIQVIGVLDDVRRGELEEEPEPTLYLSSRQTANFSANNMLVRTTADPTELIGMIRTVVKSHDPTVPLNRVETLEDRLASALAPRRFTLALVGLFSAVALLLAGIGVYGVVSESVGQRVPEIGVRVTLGASTASIVVLIVRQGAKMIVVGLAVGIAVALLGNGLMSSFVFGVTTLEPWAYGSAGCVLMLAMLAACIGPARRAARIDPVLALRQE